jgi:hypothetical protein
MWQEVGRLPQNKVGLRYADNYETGYPVRAVKVLSLKHREIRRSQRVCVSVEVEVLWGDANNLLASEKTKTLIVNSHGALVLGRKVTGGGTVRNRQK